MLTCGEETCFISATDDKRDAHAHAEMVNMSMLLGSHGASAIPCNIEAVMFDFYRRAERISTFKAQSEPKEDGNHRCCVVVTRMIIPFKSHVLARPLLVAEALTPNSRPLLAFQGAGDTSDDDAIECNRAGYCAIGELRGSEYVYSVLHMCQIRRCM